MLTYLLLVDASLNWPSLDYPYSKFHGVNMGPTWGRQDPGGPHVGPMNPAIWVENGWSPVRRQAIIGTNYDFSSITRPMRHRGTNLREILTEWQFWFNTLGPRQNGRHLVDDRFKCIFLNENVWIWVKISLTFVPKMTINNIPALVKIMAWFHGCITDAYMRHSTSTS